MQGVSFLCVTVMEIVLPLLWWVNKSADHFYDEKTKVWPKLGWQFIWDLQCLEVSVPVNGSGLP